MIRTIYKILFLASLYSFLSCAPVIRTSIQKKLPVSYEEVIIFENKDFLPEDAIKIGRVDIFDNGVSTNCGYEQVVDMAKKEASKAGGNAIHIVKHFLPDLRSTCHKIEAKIYKINDVKKYEPRFYWSENRKLVWSDFKSVNKPELFEDEAAVTYCGFGYYSNVTNALGKIEIKVFNVFQCKKSWLDTFDKNAQLLVHEQTHFDLCEVYTRKFRKTIKDLPINNFNMNNDKVESAFRRLWDEYNHKQFTYDEETVHGTIPEKQNEWNLLILKELQGMDEFKE